MKIAQFFSIPLMQGLLLQLLILLCILGLLPSTPEVYAANKPHYDNMQNDTIRFGILPYLSTKALIKKWQPFANELKMKLGKKIILTTATDYASFIKRTANYKYDYLITAPHFAVMAKQNSGYRILAGFSNRLAGEFTVLKDSPYKKISDLRGKTIATPDPLAVITILCKLTLRKHNIDPLHDITIKNTPSHNNAILHVINKKSDAAISVGGLYKKFLPKAKLRVLAKTQGIPHVMIIASPKLTKKNIELIRHELLNNKNYKLQKIIHSIGWGNLQTVSKSDILQLQELVTSLEVNMKK